MFIGHKSNTIIGIGEVEWMCYSECKELYPPDYWAWHDSITTVTGDPPDVKTTVDYSGETGYTVVNCTDEDVTARLEQLRDYILEAVEDWVKNTDDFDYAEDVLDNLMKYVEGGTNVFENIGVVKNKIDALKSELIKEKNDYNDENVKVYNNKVSTGKIVVRELLAEKMKEDNFNFYEWRKTEEYLNLIP